jgi:hypothetical protein
MLTVIVVGPVGVGSPDVAGVIVGAVEVACRAALRAAVEAKAGAAMALSATTAPPVRMIKRRRSIMGILPKVCKGGPGPRNAGLAQILVRAPAPGHPEIT